MEKVMSAIGEAIKEAQGEFDKATRTREKAQNKLRMLIDLERRAENTHDAITTEMENQ